VFEVRTLGDFGFGFVIDIDEMGQAKGPTTRAMARRIQEERALNAHARPKMNFTWAKEDVKT